MDPLVLRTLRGGLNDHETPAEIADDQVVVCVNIDWNRSTIGGKRRGSSPISVSGSTLAESVVFLHRHLPTSDETASQLWAVSVSGGTSSVFAYKDTSWHVVTPGPAAGDGLNELQGAYSIYGQTLHGKLFLAYLNQDSSIDRLHVWDGTTLRRTGLAAPAAAPLVADEGVGAYTGDRMFRVRFVIESGGVVVYRSEPSDETSFTPSGAAAGARVTKPAASGEGETHWEVEESVNSGTDWYRIATVAVGTTTYDDTLTVAEVPQQGTLSEDIGDYTNLWAAKFLAADNDRLIIAGSWFNVNYQSRVAWTPPFGAPGVGNDERLAEDTDPFLDLDGYEGGELTAIGGPVQGYLYLFKRSHIYKLIRTNQAQQSYISQNLSKTTGALPRSVVMGQDESGRPCLYFLDAKVGPCRIGANGIERCGEDIQGTWNGVNQNANLVSFGVFYPDAQQVWWWIAADTNHSAPNLKIVAQVNQFQRADDGSHRGWSTHTVDSTVLSSVLYAENIDTGGPRSLKLKPFLGMSVVNATKLIRIADTGTTDDGTTYRAYFETKPFTMRSLLARAGVMAGAVMALASDGVTLAVKLIRNYGEEEITKTVSLAPVATETRVVRDLDNLSMSDLRTLALEVGDASAIDSDWEIDQISLKMRDEETA